MRLLLDTQLLLWATTGSDLGKGARLLIDDPDNDILFSVSSLWEVAIKRALDRPGFLINPAWLRDQLLAAGYEELPILAAHALAVTTLPPIHRDPFDRILIAGAGRGPDAADDRWQDRGLPRRYPPRLTRPGDAPSTAPSPQPPPARFVHPVPQQPGARR